VEVYGMIPGVVVKDLKIIPDERGRLIEFIRADDPIFLRFGQVYATIINPGVVKGWHYHKIQTDYVACVQGMIKLVLFLPVSGEPRGCAWEYVGDSTCHSLCNGPVQELFIGVHNPKLVLIPRGVYHGWKCISDHEAVVMCLTTEPYNYAAPDEYRVDPHYNDIPYKWERRDG
jgi:dTDP-4-dehydrorhamnose 3,5-epimerase